MQADGIHPNAAGQPKLLDAAWPALEKEIRSLAGKDTAGGHATAH
jgi:lysophospholipase L1-like esterase